MEPIRCQFRSHFTASAEQLWRFHVAPDALYRLIPRLMNFKILDPGDGVADGSLVRALCGWWPLRVRWHALHASVRPGREFTDVAVRSPFPYWVHRHHIEARPGGGSTLTDVIWFTLPRVLPRSIARGPFRLALRALFWWRHRITRRSLELAPDCGRNHNAGTGPLTSCTENGG